ncbi:MAG: hypothetical protein KDA66_16545, partial [Planctomycetaceae bacterium]|nr:hypothetical protein [Planctomycetaceae bacterium]
MANKAASTNEAMVVVTGDVLIDRNLFPDDRPAAGYAAPLTSTVEIATAGGAWFLTEIIERMTCEVFPVGASQVAKVSGPSSDKFSTQPVATAHTRWRSFPYLKDGKDKSRAHRVEQFLGCQRQQKSESVAPGVEAIYEQTLKAKAK